MSLDNEVAVIQQKTITEKYNELTQEQRKQLYDLFFDPSIEEALRKNIENIIFYKIPPTPEEFLDPINGWVPKDTPETMYQFVRDEFCAILHKKDFKQIIVEYGATRIGKCEGEDTPILMYDLSVKKIQDIKVGDLLMGDDSTPRKVLHLYQGYGDLYKVTQNKADDYIVNENHVLTLQYTNKGNRKERKNNPDKNNGKIVDIPIKDYLKLSKTKKHLLKGIKAKLDFKYQEVKIDPYFLGLWLGDGSHDTTSITNIDKEIIDYIYNYATTLNLRVSETINPKRTKSYRICGNSIGKKLTESNNSLLWHLKETYSLIRNKHIPIEYLRNSEEIRLSLLAGLIDSDGYISTDQCVISITQKREDLTKNIVFLCRSLGFRANYTKIKKSIKSRNFTREYYSICITGDLHRIPNKLSRKKVVKTTSRINPLRTGIKVDFYKKGNFYGFELSGNHRYLHSDLTITHNTHMVVHLIMYTIVYFHHLREPALYYGKSSLSDLAIYIISFNYDKVHELYLNPLFKIMDRSPKFIMVKFKDMVVKKQEEVGRDFVVYSKAATTGELTLASNLQLQTGNDDALAFVGANIVQAYVSEISFWLEYGGATEERIYRLYTDLRGRIKATVGSQYLSYLFLDSSANTIDSMIEKHMTTELIDRPYVHFSWKSRWEAVPKDAPKWLATGQTFKVITGAGSIPAKIVTTVKDLEGVPSDLIVDVPIDYYDELKDNLLKNIKDILGKPTIRENKFITDTTIIDKMFNDNFYNVEGSLVANSSDLPEKLLWNQIKDKLFHNPSTGGYKLKRAPNEPRFVGLDLSFSASGDALGISIIHKEFDLVKKETAYIVDISCVVSTTDRSINLEAVAYFIVDLMQLGGMFIHTVYTDTFQSESTKQFLERHNINVIKQSVDKDISPYMLILTLLSNELIVTGRNIFLKNNLNCLMITKDKGGKEKIDHPKGTVNNKYNGDYENSTCGTFAKDCSDSLAQAIYGAYSTDTMPHTNYESENKRVNLSKVLTPNDMVDIYKTLHKFY
jgi:hypothetical protein